MQGYVFDRAELVSSFMESGDPEDILVVVDALKEWSTFAASSQDLSEVLNRCGIEVLRPSVPVKVCAPKRSSWRAEPEDSLEEDSGFWPPEGDVVVLHRCCALIRRVTILDHTLVIVKDPRTLSALLWSTLKEETWIIDYTTEYQCKEGHTNQITTIVAGETEKEPLWFQDLDYDDSSNDPPCVLDYSRHSNGLKLLLYYTIKHVCQVVLARLRMYLYLLEPVCLQESRSLPARRRDALLNVLNLCLSWFADRRDFLVMCARTLFYETEFLRLQLLLVEWDPRFRILSDPQKPCTMALGVRASRYIKRLGRKTLKLLRSPSEIFYEQRGREDFINVYGADVCTVYISYDTSYSQEGVNITVKGKVEKVKIGARGTPIPTRLPELPGKDFYMGRDHRDIYFYEWQNRTFYTDLRLGSLALELCEIKLSLYVRSCSALPSLCRHPYLGSSCEGVAFNNLKTHRTLLLSSSISWEFRSKLGSPWVGCEFLSNPHYTYFHFVSCYQMIHALLDEFKQPYRRNNPQASPIARALVVLLWTPVCGGDRCITFYDFFRLVHSHGSPFFKSVCTLLDEIPAETWKELCSMRVLQLADIEKRLSTYNVRLISTLRHVVEDRTEVPVWMDEKSFCKED